MYQPVHFREDRIEVQHDFIRTNPLGLVMTAGPRGLQANPLPFLVDSDAAQKGRLRCHMARANPHWKELNVVDQCLVVFQGPSDYVSPSWYPSKIETGKVVPTWNYATVHVWGKPQVTEDEAWLRRQLDDLTSARESGRPTPWKVEDAPAQYVASQIKGIVGVEITIDRIEGKWKVSQDRKHVDKEGVVRGLLKQGQSSKDIAALVQERSGSKSM
ncbi:MAG TPA: FMN-binding negative transcriptional regulator [Bradyrhizobium sp.]|nr:FMN-binding negative transcriptional regulator [Bradyrhizobium sp.]